MMFIHKIKRKVTRDLFSICTKFKKQRKENDKQFLLLIFAVNSLNLFVQLHPAGEIKLLIPNINICTQTQESKNGIVFYTFQFNTNFTAIVMNLKLVGESVCPQLPPR